MKTKTKTKTNPALDHMKSELASYKTEDMTSQGRLLSQESSSYQTCHLVRRQCTESSQTRFQCESMSAWSKDLNKTKCTRFSLSLVIIYNVPYMPQIMCHNNSPQEVKKKKKIHLMISAGLFHWIVQFIHILQMSTIIYEIYCIFEQIHNKQAT